MSKARGARAVLREPAVPAAEASRLRDSLRTSGRRCFRREPACHISDRTSETPSHSACFGSILCRRGPLAHGRSVEISERENDGDSVCEGGPQGLGRAGPPCLRRCRSPACKRCSRGLCAGTTPRHFSNDSWCDRGCRSGRRGWDDQSRVARVSRRAVRTRFDRCQHPRGYRTLRQRRFEDCIRRSCHTRYRRCLDIGSDRGVVSAAGRGRCAACSRRFRSGRAPAHAAWILGAIGRRACRDWDHLGARHRRRALADILAAPHRR